MIELFPRFTQETRFLRLLTPLGADKLLVESLRVEEGLSTNFSIQLTALSTDAHISLRALIGQPALVEILTVTTSMKQRPFHGYITSAECIGANGGFARYHFTIEPWMIFLQYGRDCKTFQDKTVFEILDAIFKGMWSSIGKIVPEWRYEIADRNIYPQRSLTCQYQETSLAFVERLMCEEGLFYFFEHNADSSNRNFGTHTLVIADHNNSFRPNIQNNVRFSQTGAVMREDSIDRWHTIKRASVTGITIKSWDYRSLNDRSVSIRDTENNDAQGMTNDSPGIYAYESRAQGLRLIKNQLQALQVKKELHHGAGTVRTLAPGTTFVLHGQAYLDQLKNDAARTFIAVNVTHWANNNLSADLRVAISQALGEGTTHDFAVEPSEGSHKSAATPKERPLYRNRIDAIKKEIPYRSSDVDGHGIRLHPRPTVRGQQTAIVVGPPGAVIYTDRDHRIKVQFHWQRNIASDDQSHSRLSHPAPEGQSGATADNRSSTWVRLVTPLGAIAGANWGAVAIPRVGSEVLVDFLDGDIDRPVVIASSYNGQGKRDAQENQANYGAGATTGNAPPWFAGDNGAHAHPAVLSGLKTQNMSASQIGNGAYNQLVFDDSVSQPRLALQNHASAHTGTAELNLGTLFHQVDNQRLRIGGYGAELKTKHHASLRAGQGLLLSTSTFSGESSNQLDSPDTQIQLEQSYTLQTSLARSAHQHNAVLPSHIARSGVETATLSALSEMESSIDIIKACSGKNTIVTENEIRQVPAYSQPQLQLSSPAGILTSTPGNANFSAGVTTSISTNQDLDLLAQGNNTHLVKAGICIFTYGKANEKTKPNQENGVRLHAASGKFDSQSQSGATHITANNIINVASITKSVSVAADKHVLLTAQGAFLKLDGGNIMLSAPGKVNFMATKKELGTPVSASLNKLNLPKSKDIYNEAFVIVNDETKKPMAHVRYRLESVSGVVLEGFTDALGRTQRIFTSKIEELTLHLPKED